jgi:hypothetical protein
MSALDGLFRPISLNQLLGVGETTSQNLPESPTLEKSSQLEEVSLNEKKRAAVELLALGKSYTVTAKTVGVDRRKIFEWRQEELFQSELRRRHQQLWGDTVELLTMLADPSVEVLVEHLNDNYERNRFRAATTILKLVKLGTREASE